MILLLLKYRHILFSKFWNLDYYGGAGGESSSEESLD